MRASVHVLVCVDAKSKLEVILKKKVPRGAEAEQGGESQGRGYEGAGA